MNFSYFKSKSFLTPSLLFLAFLIIFIILFQIGETKYYNLDRTLIQWDGQHYRDIARNGYEKFPCPENSNEICGNTGWFPFYPLVGYILSWLPININWVMILISWISLWIALIILYTLIEHKYGDRKAVLTLMALLLYPGSFYFLTGFPYALYLLLAVLIFYLLDRQKYLPIIILSGLLTVTYPSGILIGIPILTYLIFSWKKLTKPEKNKIIFSLLSVGLALFLYYSYNWYKFDDFFLYNHFQSKSYYAHELSFPFIVIFDTLYNYPVGNPVWIILTYAIITMIIFYTNKIPHGWQFYLLSVLLFTPAFGTADCYYRHIVVAFPLFIMIGVNTDSTMKRRIIFSLYCIISIILTLYIYLPLYKNGQLM